MVLWFAENNAFLTAILCYSHVTMLQCDVIVSFLFVLRSHMMYRYFPIVYRIILWIFLFFPSDMLTHGWFPWGMVFSFVSIVYIRSSFPWIKRAFSSTPFLSFFVQRTQNDPITYLTSYVPLFLFLMQNDIGLCTTAAVWTPIVTEPRSLTNQKTRFSMNFDW